MTVSSLCTYVNLTSNHTEGRGGERICKITPHCMDAPWSGEHCADYFDGLERPASSNYCIGVGGDIAMSVDEDNRAWTSGSGWNDRKAITIECGNLSDGSFAAATWESLVNLCVDVCTRYGFRLNYDGTPNGSLTEHRMFQNTDCPGAWAHERMAQLAEEVNARLDGKGTAMATPGEVWTYHWVNPEGEETAVGGNVYNALMSTCLCAFRIEAKLDALVEKMRDVDETAVAEAAYKAVEAKLSSIRVSITDSDGKEA